MGSKTETLQKGLQSALRENVIPTVACEEEEQQKRRESVLELNGYIVQETIGNGAFSNVKVRLLYLVLFSFARLNENCLSFDQQIHLLLPLQRAFSKSLNHPVAIKIISKQKATKDVLEKFLPREIELVRNLKHANLIRFHECIETTLR